AVALVTGPQPLRRHLEARDGERPVLCDLASVVARTEAAIQRREHPLADPAAAGKEGMTGDAARGKGVERDPVGGRHQSPANPAGAGRPGDTIAMALNKGPISPGSIKRRSPEASAPPRSGGAACSNRC